MLGQKTFSGESWPLKHPSGPEIWLGGGNAISLYREGGIKLSRKHLQAACRKGMLLDYQLCFFFMFFNLFSFPNLDGWSHLCCSSITLVVCGLLLVVRLCLEFRHQ